MMLQNELFQREVRAALGDDFMQGAQPSHGAQPGAPPMQRTASQQQAPAAAAGSADLGIMKALASMGSATKRNLSSMATRFSASSAPPRRSQEAGTQREFRPLVESNHLEDEDGDTEVISFSQGNRSQHMLQGQGPGRGGGADSDEEGDSENPLIMQSSGGGGAGVRNITVNKKAV